jgi:amino acid transporter
MQTWLLGVVIVGVSVLVAHVGLRLVRRRVPLPVLQTQHEVAGFIIGVLGAIYAVLLAFVVVVVWNQFEDAKSTVEKEANQLNDLSRIAQGFSAPGQQRMLEGLRAYTQAVVSDEWKTMSEGRASEKAQAAMEDLWRIYRELEPQTNRENALYGESLDRLSDVSDNRRLRIYASRDDVPAVVQVLLWGGGLITIAFTYFFGVKSVRAQALMTAALAGVVAFILFLVVVLDNPFHGYLRVTPEPMQEVLDRIKTIPATPQ